MLKVSHRVSEIMPLSHEDDEVALRRSEITETPDKGNFSMTMSKFKDIMAKALEDQKNLADATSAEAIKAAFTKGVKHRSEMQTQPLHSSPMETETLHQNLIAPSDEYRLNAIHQPRPATRIAMTPSVVNKAIPVQQAANMPIVSTNNRVIDGSKTLETISSFNTGKRYKRETTLKMSDGSVESYESLKSQFNIHDKMLGWDTNRTGVELYMSLESKAALKVEEVIMVCLTSPKCGILLTVLSCQSIIVNRNIGSSLRDDGDSVNE